MNEYFINGFEKIASPELVEQSQSGYGYMDPSEHQKKRQRILEQYEAAANKEKDTPAKSDKIVKEEPGTKAETALGYQGTRG